MSLLEKIGAVVAAIGAIVLVVVTLGAYRRQKARADDLGQSAVKLAKENAARAKEQAKAEAEAKKAEAVADIAKSDAAAKEAQDDAERAGAAGLVERINSRR